MLIGALGLDHFSPFPKKVRSNVISVDLCARGIILSGWRTGVESNESIQVYNAASMRTFSYPILNTMVEIPRKFETLQTVAPCYGVCVENRLLNFIIKMFVVWIPFFVLDVVLFIINQKPKLMKVQRIVQNVYNSLSHFLCTQFAIDNFKFLDLNKSLVGDEKDEFEITLKGTLYDICEGYYRYVVEHTFKEDAAKRAQAKKRYPLIWAFHYGFLSIYAYIIYKIFSMIIVNWFSRVDVVCKSFGRWLK